MQADVFRSHFIGAPGHRLVSGDPGSHIAGIDVTTKKRSHRGADVPAILVASVFLAGSAFQICVIGRFEPLRIAGGRIEGDPCWEANPEGSS